MSTHHHHHDSQPPHPDDLTQATWDARYSGSTRVWSGNPNPRLVEHVTRLQASGTAPGTALDVGAGEGADSVWLASQGWQVTALDISEVALGRVAQHATDSGVADRVTTVHHDLTTDAPLPGTYDLVSAQFWHPPADQRAENLARIGAAVRPGGTLLIVGHHPADLATGLRSGHGHAERVFTPEQIAALLPADQWDVQVCDSPTRPFVTDDGPVTLTDAVVLAVRG